MWSSISALCWFSANCGVSHQPLWKHLCIDHRWVQSLVGAEPSMAQCAHDQWEDSNSAWLIIPSAIISSSCCPAQPWCRQCLGEKTNIFLSDKRVWKTFLIFGCDELRREGEKEELEIIVCHAHTKKVFLLLSCLINRQNFTPCRPSSPVLPLFLRLLPLGSF